MIRRIRPYVPVLFGRLILLAACSPSDSGRSYPDTPQHGSIQVSIDESFRPVMEEQIRMYELTYPDTRIRARYCSEADGFRDFFRDTTNRLIIAGRGLTRAEERYMNDSLGYLPSWQQIASDAVVLLLHPTDADTLYTLERLRELFSGRAGKDRRVVLDGLNATSTVRYLRDSVLKGAPYDSSVVRAVSSSPDVVDYVATHPGSLGLVGFSWLGNPEDSVQVARSRKVKTAFLRCEPCEGKPYIRPSQASVMSRRYPLTRGIFYILKENYTGLGTGFTSFLKYERGQLLFRRSYLSPVMDFRLRDVKINVQPAKK